MCQKKNQSDAPNYRNNKSLPYLNDDHYIYQTFQEMKKKIESFKNSRALANGDISVVMIMSHGTNKDNNNIPVSGSFTQIVTYDGKFLDTEEVVAEFSAENCPGMKGKPKIFIFQCCR